MTPTNPVIRLLLLFLTLLASLPQLSAGSVLFSFTIPSGATTTSAGVFASDGTLLRTLWNNEAAVVGPNEAVWDGLDDEGQPVTPGAYTIKVLHSEISYTWDGTIGNTSTQQTGVTVRRTFEPIHDLVIVGSEMIFAYGYNEKKALYSRSSTSTPNEVGTDGRSESARQFSFAATDGTRVYFAQVGNALKSNWPSFVVAYNVSDDSQVVFSSGVIEAPGTMQWNNVIDRQVAGDGGFTGKQNAATGIAVQTSANHLFVSHASYNKIRVFNKLTGATIAATSPTITAPGRLAMTRDDAGLWAIVTESGNRVVRRYNIDSSGNLTLGALITGLSDPLALAVSPDNTTLLVADGGSSQQVKGFANVSTGTPSSLWTPLGVAGGYSGTNGSLVANDKFNFRIVERDPVNDYPLSYLAYQPDGSFWVGDPGNERNLRFSASRTYLDQIMYLPHSYVLTVCAGDSTRVFSGWKEFAVDYSLPIKQGWTYVRDWSAGLSRSVSDVSFYGFNSVVKRDGVTFGMANGKLYKLNTTSGLLEPIVPSGFTLTSEILHEDGSLRRAHIPNPSDKAFYYKRAYAGLSGGLPTWGSETLLATTPVNSTTPRTNSGGRGGSGVRHPSTASGLMIYSDGTDARYHLGAVPEGGSALKWRSAPSGRFFDTHGTVGTLGDYPCNNAYTSGDHIVLAAHGEGATDIYQRTYQANQFLHFWPNGLQVGQFGSPLNYPTNPLYPEAPWLPPGLYPGRAGNALSSAFAPVGSDLYFWHCDESQSSGIHRWKINNPDSVEEIPVNVTLPGGSNGTGITGQYFNGTDTETYTLVTSGTDATVDFNWGSGSPASGVNADNFSARWTGLIQPLHTQTYTFTVNKALANNARLYINHVLVADGWTTTGTSISGNIALTAGQKYFILLEYRDATIGSAASVSLQWQSSSQSLQVVPFRQLYPSDTVAINFGGPAVGRFAADPFVISSSNQKVTTTNVVTTGLADPAPQQAYRDARQGSFTAIGLIELAPYTQYRVRLHMAEIVNDPQYYGIGKRIFDFTIPDLSTVIDDIDIFNLAGGGHKAVILEEILSTDNAGHLRIGFDYTPVGAQKNFSLINALEIYRDPSDQPAFASIGTGNGLKGEYFSDTTFGTLVATRVDPDVNFVWTTGNPPPGIPSNTNYTVRWTGQVLSILDGTYTFRVEHDNGAKLWVNGVLLINQWGTTGGHQNTITLAGATKYDIQLEYLQTTGGAHAELKWLRPSGGSAFTLVPRSQLYTDYAPPGAPVDVIVDNADGAGAVTITGSWTTTTGSGVYGANFIHDVNTGKGSKTVKFTPDLPSAGVYDVYARWVANTNRPTNTPFIIDHAGGTTTVPVNQQINGGTWILIGTHSFNAGTGGSVTISNTGTLGYVIADAVRFVKP